MNQVFVPGLIRRLMAVLLGVGFSAIVLASIETYTFEEDAMRERYQVLVEELRCPKCQNQNIADSNAPIAQDMRREVYKELQNGASDQAIVQAMVARFGEFVSYRPGFDQRTWVLWLGPLLAVLLGVLAVLVMARRSRRSRPVRLSDTEQARLASLLNESTSTPGNHRDA